MTYTWTNENIEKILIQLNDQKLPFKKYELCGLGEGLKLLGRGGYANVYAARSRNRHKDRYAIKIAGFGDKIADPAEFRRIASIQQTLSQLQFNIVDILDFTELRVWIEGDDSVVKAEKVSEDESKMPSGDYIYLQITVMERISPVMQCRIHGKPSVIPQALANAEEKEIVKFALDIGAAISYAHDRKLLHRDIKLENVFYTPRGANYKLGDFGIAKETNDGMASTVAFTRGYGAPEVVSALDEQYDCTADIYSFGMMLFVLLNELKFPDSNSYCVNLRTQYAEGYVLPVPLHGSVELYSIIARMCSFDPDNRYQSMKEVLSALDKLEYGLNINYKRKHKSLSLILGSACALTGAMVWKLSFSPHTTVELSVVMYIFLAMCIWAGISNGGAREFGWKDQLVLYVGIYLLITAGFSWPGLLLLFFLLFCRGIYLSLFGTGVLLIRAVYLLSLSQPSLITEFQNLKWAAVFLLSLAVILLFNCSVLEVRDLTNMYYKNNHYWLFLSLCYFLLIKNWYVCNSILRLPAGWQPLKWLLLKPNDVLYDMGLSPRDLEMVGIGGLAFCILWMLRERYLIMIEKSQEEKLLRASDQNVRNEGN